ncbi:MAG: histidine kinase dimerization/phospho-acceptor domain-containing protein, partial [Neisseria sp.]|nr:histidine kinase dimerization/phospho-acceptor domain-containing protein [Neisseria sp.]
MLSAFDVQTANQSITQSFMDFKHTQNKRFALPDSLQWRINLALAVIALLAASATGAWIFADVYRSSKTVQDQTLRQISAYVDASKAAPVFAPNENEERIFVQTEVSSEQDEHFLFLSSKIKDGFSTVFDEDNRSFRIFVRNGERGRVVVMQANEYREQAAKSLALNASLPFIVFIPLMCSLIWWIIRRTMRPVRELSAELETRQSQDLSPLATDGVPSEVGGFVQAINHLLRRTDTLLAQQRRFIADAAHEMRSPFTALSVQAERLAQQDLTPNVQEQVNALQASIQRNRHLLEQLLSLAKAQADGT